MVAMTLITPGSGGAAVRAGEDAAAVAVAAAATASRAVAAVDKTACQVSFMTTFFLAGHAAPCPRGVSRSGQLRRRAAPPTSNCARSSPHSSRLGNDQTARPEHVVPRHFALDDVGKAHPLTSKLVVALPAGAIDEGPVLGGATWGPDGNDRFAIYDHLIDSEAKIVIYLPVFPHVVREGVGPGEPF